jgi:hypothetical protein
MTLSDCPQASDGLTRIKGNLIRDYSADKTKIHVNLFCFL